MAGERHGNGMLCVNRPYIVRKLEFVLLEAIRLFFISLSVVFIVYTG